MEITCGQVTGQEIRTGKIDLGLQVNAYILWLANFS